MTPKTPIWRPDQHVIDRALSVAHDVTSRDGAVRALQRYYAVESDYAGATFANLAPSVPNQVTPTDLLATSMLSVSIPPIAVRRLTGESQTAKEAEALLSRLDPQLDISAGQEHAKTMSDFYGLVKSSLHKVGTRRSNPWVTASKICARKRPHLFPVRDTVVVDVLGLKNNYPDDWPVFATMMGDTELTRRLDGLVREAAKDTTVDVGDAHMRLKHLDVLLWMHGTGRL